MNTRNVIVLVVVLILVFWLAAAIEQAPQTGPIYSGEGAPPGSIHNLPVPKAVAMVRTFVAQGVGIAENEVIILNVEEREWSDSCLGLGASNESCLQAITPGFRVTATARGRQFVYRTNEDGSAIRAE